MFSISCLNRNRLPSRFVRSLSDLSASSDGLLYCTNIVREDLKMLLKRDCPLHYDVVVYSGIYCPIRGIETVPKVRQHDYENFLATLLMTKVIRSPALVLRAFNVEIARIQDQTTDLQTAAFRLQFWQDTLTRIYQKDQKLKNIPANPIAQELFKVCNCYKLPQRHLTGLITSRKNLLKSKYFQSLEDIEAYTEKSVSSIYHSIISIADIANIHVDHAASHLGKAQGITNILRSINVSNHHKVVLLPMDMLMKHQISQENVLRGLDSDNMRNVTYDIASRANSHLKKARSITVPKEANQIFLPAIAIDVYLTRLQKCNFNIFDKSLQLGSAILPFKLYFKRLRNKY